jgi:methionine-rich copper-binding protein CopC
MRSFRLGLAVALGVLTLAPPSASARAVYRDSSPSADSRVVGAPRDVLITFSDPIKTISLMIRGPGGVDVRNGPPLINTTDPTNVSVPIHSAGDGHYQVDWDVVSGYDIDESSGSFGFWIGLPPPVALTPTPAVPTPAAMAVAPIPPPPSPDVARDGRTLAGEPLATQALFRGLWGDRAAVEWAAEHNAALAAAGV